MSDLILDSDVSGTKKAMSGAAQIAEARQKPMSSIVTPARDQRVNLPLIYTWYDKEQELLTGCFKWQGKDWGYSIPTTFERRDIDRKHLKHTLRDTLDILVHHGKDVVQKDGQINWKKAHNMEADRFWQDPMWRDRVLAFRRACRFADITKERAEELKL